MAEGPQDSKQERPLTIGAAFSNSFKPITKEKDYFMLKYIAAAIAVAFALITTPALATPIDFLTPITQLDGKPFTKIGELSEAERKVVGDLIARGYTVGEPEPSTLGLVAKNAVLATYQDEPTLSGDEKAKRYALALKIQDAVGDKAGMFHGQLDLKAGEIELLKKLIAKSYNPLVVGQTWKILDPASMKE